MNNFDWGDKTILIVDDNNINSLLLKHMLLPTKIKFIFAKNSKEFYSVINSKINLILMDIHLGEETTGFDLINFLTENKINIPVILQTAYDLNEISLINNNYEKYIIIRKPINKNLLLETINNYIV